MELAYDVTINTGQTTKVADDIRQTNMAATLNSHNHHKLILIMSVDNNTITIFIKHNCNMHGNNSAYII